MRGCNIEIESSFWLIVDTCWNLWNLDCPENEIVYGLLTIEEGND